MKVYLDCSPLTNAQTSGIGVYNKNLFFGLKSELGSDVFPVLKWSRLRHAEVAKIHLQQVVLPLPPFLLKKDVIYHGVDHKINTRSLGPTVVTIHDMQPFLGKWLDPKFAKKRVELISKTLRSDVDRIIAVSHFTKKEILNLFPHLESKIDVVYHGVTIEEHGSSEESQNISRLKNIIKDRPFLFFIGNLEERKNLINQIKAFEILKEKNKSLLFILAGNPGFNYSEIQNYIAHSRFRDDLILTGYLNDAEKDYALKNTSCLMFASWYEGFGIPVIEALGKNANLLISNAGALREISAGYCHQCDPSDPLDISEKVKIITENGNIKKIDLNLWSENWSWEKCARETIGVYQKTL